VVPVVLLCGARESRLCDCPSRGGQTGAPRRAPDFEGAPLRPWREYGPEDTVRLYGLRLHVVGMLKSSPQKLIAQGTDWHFPNELKRELKG
jgi:hypothetical protein